MGTEILTSRPLDSGYAHLVSAAKNGKILQFRTESETEWADLVTVSFCSAPEYYRVKPESEDTAPPPDNINPSHYTSSGIECIEYQKAVSSPEEFRGYLRLCATKYLHRLYKKGEALENLDKALWYLNRLRKELTDEH